MKKKTKKSTKQKNKKIQSSPQTVSLAVFKFIALIFISVTCFLTDDSRYILPLLIIPSVMWLLPPLSLFKLLKKLRRVAFFVVFIFVSYLFFPESTQPPYFLITLFQGSSFKIYESALSAGLLMTSRILIIVISSFYVQSTTASADFIRAMEKLRIPQGVALSVNLALSLLGKDPENKKDKNRIRPKDFLNGESVDKKAGKLAGFINEKISAAQHELEQDLPGLDSRLARDTAAVAALTFVSMSIKFMKVMPGMPVAPGHKNVIIIPLYLLASEITENRFGGTWFGACLGIISFSFGEGQFGIFEIFKYLIPGLLLDLGRPLLERYLKPPRFWAVALCSVAATLARLGTIILIAVLVKAPAVFFAFIIPMSWSHLFWGASSSFISFAFLKAYAVQPRRVA